MKKYFFCLAVAMLAPVAQANASNVNVGVSIGVPAAPVYASPEIVISSPPEFVAPSRLGFYVAVGVPYDMFFFSGSYYLSRGSVWYSSPYYNGPWTTVHYKRVPYEIRRHPFERIHYYRDSYYNRHHDNPGREYRHFRPERRDWDGDRRGRGHDDRPGEHRGWDDGGRGHGHGHDRR
jgi:hypothetical protein